MPRIIYAMSSDGLLFSFLSHIFPPTGTPLIATIITGLFASILALIVSLRDLIGKPTLNYVTFLTSNDLRLIYRNDVDWNSFGLHISGNINPYPSVPTKCDARQGDGGR